jgi:hypothetical protein
MELSEMKQAGKGKINPEAAQRKGDVAKGHALAIQCVRYATEEAKAEEARGQKRMRFVADIANLTPAGHAEFRKELQIELAALTDVEKVTGQADSRHGGYAASSFRVMVSNWRTISAACELGYKPFNEDGSAKAWETVLTEARETRKTQQASGNAAVIEGTRKQGAGRKALTDYDKTLRLASKLNLRDLRKLQAAVNGLIEAAETKSPKRGSAPVPAAAVVH